MHICSKEGSEKDVGIVLMLLHETAMTVMAASTVPLRMRTKVWKG